MSIQTRHRTDKGLINLDHRLIKVCSRVQFLFSYNRHTAWRMPQNSERVYAERDLRFLSFDRRSAEENVIHPRLTPSFPRGHA